MQFVDKQNLSSILEGFLPFPVTEHLYQVFIKMDVQSRNLPNIMYVKYVTPPTLQAKILLCINFTNVTFTHPTLSISDKNACSLFLSACSK